MASEPTRLPCSPRLTSLPQALIEAAKVWRSHMDARLRPLGLSNAMWSVLSCLAEHDTALTQRELAQAVGVEGPTLVRLLDRLEKGQWAKREPDPDDRRINRVRLTDKALPCCDRLRDIGEQVCLDLLRDIPQADIAAAHKVLLAMRDSSKSSASPDGNKTVQRFRGEKNTV